MRDKNTKNSLYPFVTSISRKIEVLDYIPISDFANTPLFLVSAVPTLGKLKQLFFFKQSSDSVCTLSSYSTILPTRTHYCHSN